MANLFDYLERELAPFAEKPLNPVDSAVLAQLTMVDGAGVVPPLRERRFASPVLDALASRLARIGQAPVRPVDLFRAEHWASRGEGAFEGLSPADVKHELASLVASPRFRDIEISDYASVLDEQRSIQFSAVTYVSPGNFAYVAYRGTDVSFAGWRENFETAYAAPTQAQDMATEYLELAARHVPTGLPLFVGGHSKGGNYALFAALTCDTRVQDRIARVYVHDAPGFKRGLFGAADYAPLQGRIDKTVPQDALVGLLLDYPGPVRAVASSEHGLMQHSLFSWQVDVEAGDFVVLPAVSESARFTGELVTDWISSYDEGEVAAIAAALFRAIEASGAQDAADILLADSKKLLALLGEAARQADDKTRATLMRAVSDLTALAVKKAGKGMIASWRFGRAAGKETAAADGADAGDERACDRDAGGDGADELDGSARGSGKDAHGAKR